MQVENLEFWVDVLVPLLRAYLVIEDGESDSVSLITARLHESHSHRFLGISTALVLYLAPRYPPIPVISPSIVCLYSSHHVFDCSYSNPYLELQQVLSCHLSAGNMINGNKQYTS